MEVNVGAWNATETMRNFDDFRISRCGAPLTRARAHARCLEFNQRRNPTAALPPRYRLCEGTKLLSWQFPPEEEKKERERERERGREEGVCLLVHLTVHLSSPEDGEQPAQH